MDGKQENPPFAESYGGAQETKMNAEHIGLQGPSREEAQKIRDDVGLTPEGVEGINQPKSDQGDPLNNSRVEKAVNVAAALTTAVAVVGLAAVAGDALKNSPSPITQEQRPDPKRDNPPQGVVFGEVEKVGRVEKVDGPIRQALRPRAQGRVAQGKPFGDAQGKRADGSTGSPQSAPAMEVKPTRIFIPMVAKNFREPETPLYLREFGAPERGVVMKNKVEQGGGNLAYVEMGDQELWNNLLYLRETYGRPDLKLEITYYSSLELYSRDPNRPNYNPENNFVIYWDVWAGNPGIYKNGVRIFSYREADKTLEFRIVLPEPFPGKVPTEDSVNKMHFHFTGDMRKVFLSKEDGKPTEAYRNYNANKEPESSDFDNHPVWVGGLPPPNVLYTTRSALWVKLE